MVLPFQVVVEAATRPLGALARESVCWCCARNAFLSPICPAGAGLNSTVGGLSART